MSSHEGVKMHTMREMMHKSYIYLGKNTAKVSYIIYVSLSLLAFRPMTFRESIETETIWTDALNVNWLF